MRWARHFARDRAEQALGRPQDSASTSPPPVMRTRTTSAGVPATGEARWCGCSAARVAFPAPQSTVWCRFSDTASRALPHEPTRAPPHPEPPHPAVAWPTKLSPGPGQPSVDGRTPRAPAWPASARVHGSTMTCTPAVGGMNAFTCPFTPLGNARSLRTGFLSKRAEPVDVGISDRG
jgi:hypothetical protein